MKNSNNCRKREQRIQYILLKIEKELQQANEKMRAEDDKEQQKKIITLILHPPPTN